MGTRPSQEPSYIKAYISGVAFSEKSTPDYTWDGVFVENKKLETKYLPDDLMNWLMQLGEEVSTAQSAAEYAQEAARNAQYTADDAQSTAYNAQTIAGNAHTTAGNAETTADKAQTTANNAQTTANKAQSTANKAQTTAQSALSMLPTVTSTDSGKFLRVSSAGKWVAEAIASAEGASF